MSKDAEKNGSTISALRIIVTVLSSLVIVSFGWLHYDAKSDLKTAAAEVAEAKNINTEQEVRIKHLEKQSEEFIKVKEEIKKQGQSIGKIETHLEYIIQKIK